MPSNLARAGFDLIGTAQIAITSAIELEKALKAEITRTNIRSLEALATATKPFQGEIPDIKRLLSMTTEELTAFPESKITFTDTQSNTRDIELHCSDFKIIYKGKQGEVTDILIKLEKGAGVMRFCAMDEIRSGKIPEGYKLNPYGEEAREIANGIGVQLLVTDNYHQALVAHVKTLPGKMELVDQDIPGVIAEAVQKTPATQQAEAQKVISRGVVTDFIVNMPEAVSEGMRVAVKAFLSVATVATLLAIAVWTYFNPDSLVDHESVRAMTASLPLMLFGVPLDRVKAFFGRMADSRREARLRKGRTSTRLVGEVLGPREVLSGSPMSQALPDVGLVTDGKVGPLYNETTVPVNMVSAKAPEVVTPMANVSAADAVFKSGALKAEGEGSTVDPAPFVANARAWMTSNFQWWDGWDVNTEYFSMDGTTPVVSYFQPDFSMKRSILFYSETDPRVQSAPVPVNVPLADMLLKQDIDAAFKGVFQ
ncbi:MAG: hypothetical protein HQL30_02355, partial [Candidatus Omnitrophica bacterium]|nr:hypothetical protein [Candidatus Omnitrophota bacterium]